MQWAALTAWLMTALGGLTLGYIWLRHGGLQQKEGIRPGRLAAHLAVAVGGLVLWAVYIWGKNETVAWVAVGMLGAVTAIGFTMLTISLRGRTRRLRTEAPAEGIFPLPLVLLHGLLAAITVILAILSASKIGR